MEATHSFLIDEISQQTARILDFHTFRNSPILSRFLEYIVEETIQERAMHIKEYNIALNVLNRPPDFNPNEDSIVRIHAGRLRRALNDYYLTQGLYDPIIVHIPKGCYMPQFIEGGPLKSKDIVAVLPPSQDNKPIVAVFPFRTTSQMQDMTEFSLILSELFSAELSRFPEVSVIGYYSMEMMAKIKENIVEAGKSIHADYIITGNLQNSDRTIRIRVNMFTTTTGEVLMTRSFEREILDPDFFEIQDEIVQNIIAEVENHHSLIRRETAKAAATIEPINSGKY